MMLFEPERHESRRDVAWDEAQARNVIQEIADDAVPELGEGVTWRWHPLDESEPPEVEHKSLYLGAAGVLWALWWLARAGAARLEVDWADRIERVRVAYRAQPDTGESVPSYFLGETGILLVQLRIGGGVANAGPVDDVIAGRMEAAIRENIPNPTNEALWAAPGTMVAALRMHEWTGEPRWAELFGANVEQLWRTWTDGEHGHLWTQDLYGQVRRLLGAAHGFAGNVYPLLAGAALLADERREELYERCVDTLARTAIVDGATVNWPPGVDAPRSGRTTMLVQWCHGAPGVITALQAFPRGRSPELERMLIGAGELIWRAGPLVKGFGLCHGTAGNGLALLALHRRTGDPVWLARARSFAMHAIAQAEAMRDMHGRRRHTLWTGDPGLAVYLWQCITGEAGMPSLDLL